MQEINIGELIKTVLANKGITVTEFAKRINKSRENIYSIFSRKSIDTDLLAKISEVLEYDFFRHYSTTYQEMEEKIQHLEDQNDLLKEYASLLKQNKSKE